MAKEKADDARLRFNAGAAAYRNNDLTNAATWFESATGAPDLGLQQQAYYNLGNTRFRLGEAAADPQAKLKEWEQSVQNYGSALKLNQTDTNAASNLALVQRALEQLRQQMPQQPQQGQDDQKKQDQKDDPKDQQQSPNKDSQNQPNPKQQSKNQQPQDQQSDPQQSDKDSSAEKQESQEQSKSQDAGKDSKGADETEQQRNAQQQAGQQSGQEKGGQDKEGQGNEAFADEQGKPGEMSAVQAERLLDQQKGEEKALIFRMGGSGKEAGQRARKNMKQW